MPYKIRPQKEKEVAQIQVVSRGQALMESLSERPQLIWGGIVLLVVIAVFTFYTQSTRQNAEEVAWTIEAEASKLLHDPPPLPKPIEEGDEDVPLEIMNETQRIEKSLERYAEILAKHGNTDAARIALFESANAHAKLEKDEQATEKYMAFITKYPESKKLVVLSHLRLAYLEQKKGDDAAAIDRFRMIYEMPASDNKDQAGFELARALEVSGKDDEAKVLYQKLSEDYVETPWGTEAKARSLLLSPPQVDSTEEESATETSSETPQSDSSNIGSAIGSANTEE
ncbi:hypothetical protein MNBD_NITROSPIRAE01-398 [hydrothermal vent metagenome]|uniref:Tetratricopeptide repeat-like domain-containing protein n=1 Tax=hydrothermal vent metagenome TaxID=652676 RepID=A0A3B1CGQ3_9ZZZZ